MQHTFVSRSSRLFAGPASLAGSNTTILGWGLVTVQLAQSLQQVGSWGVRAWVAVRCQQDG